MSNYRCKPQKDLAKNEKAYKMVDVSTELGLTPRAIRYYESEGLLGDIRRSIGFTRYFNDSDLIRLKEIITLKKKGMKIAEIKALFKKKYPYLPDSMMHSAMVDSAFVAPNEVVRCQKMGIEICPLILNINGVEMDYLNWQDVSMDTFLSPFHILKHGQPMKKKDRHHFWQGSTVRCLVNAALQQFLEKPLTQDLLETPQDNMTEWLLLPVGIQATGVFCDHLSRHVMVERRSLNKNERQIVAIDHVIQFMQKQLKQSIILANGRVTFVTLHRTKGTLFSDQMVHAIDDLIANHERLSIEDLSPIYIHDLGSLDAILISLLV